MKTIKVSSILNCPLGVARQYAKKPQLFVFVSQPFGDATPIDPPQFPEEWDEGTYRIGLKLLGKIPSGEQTLKLSYPQVENTATQFVMVDDGFGDAVRQWHHRMTLTAEDNQTHYADCIELDAGLMTLAVAKFVKRLYQHRHKRWAELVKEDFGQLK